MTMKLYLVRHAAAVDRTAGMSDEERYLTPEGRDFFRKTARTMLGKGIDPNLIITSPLLRAVQTADILAETLSYRGPLVVRNELQPGFAMPALLRLLNEFRTVSELALVGHEPDLSGITTALLALPYGLSFRKGTAVKLKIDTTELPAPATFKWLATGGKVIASREEAFGF
jgi:phosphohistidine phosphatase